MVDVIRQKTDFGKKLEFILKNLDGKVTKVGWFEKSKYENGIQVAAVAAIQEFGLLSRNIPPRPFMRPTIINKKQEWKKIAELGAKSVINGNKNISDIMEALGLKAASDIRKTISSIWSPALAEKTILARLSRSSKLSKIKGRLTEKSIGNITKPLIDTGVMFATLTNMVENK